MYYCKTHTYLILLNRQRTDKGSDFAQAATVKVSSSFRPLNRAPSAQLSPTTLPQSPSRGRPLVLASSQGILSAFLFFYTRAPASLVSWDIGQQAFNSAMILLLDALETGNLTHVRKVEQAYVVFRDLQDNGVHQLAGLAVEKLSWGLDRLRKDMEASSNHYSLGNIESERATEVEASRIKGTQQHDVVMDNTGMLLLEEVGLQSHTLERFAPFTWTIPGSGSEAATPSGLKQEHEPPLHDETKYSTFKELERSNTIAPLTRELHRNAECPRGSAMGQYCAPSLQETHCRQSRATSSTSPVSLAPPSSQRDRVDGTTVNHYQCLQQDQSPHSKRMKSRRTTPASSFGNTQSPEYETDGNDGINCPQRWAQPALTPERRQSSAAQLRHNSCPSLQQLAMTPPLPRSTYSSPLTTQVYNPIGDDSYEMQMQWSANAAGPLSDTLASGMVLSPLSVQGPVTPASRYESAQQQQTGLRYSLPTHRTGASANTIATTGAEQMTVDQWKRWVGSGAG